MKIIGKPKIKYYVIHHTAVSRFKSPTQLHQVNNYHRTKDWGGGWTQTNPSSLGWWVGYNFFTDSDGKTTQTRAIGEETIAQKGMNCDVPERCLAISHCLSGNFLNEQPSQAQEARVIFGLAQAMIHFPSIQLKQHKDIQPSRTCACLDPKTLVRWQKQAFKLSKLMQKGKKLDISGVLTIDLVQELMKRDDWAKVLITELQKKSR